MTGFVAAENALLVAVIHGAEQFVDIDIGRDADLVEVTGDAVDLALTRQEDQHGLGLVGREFGGKPGDVAGDIGFHVFRLVATKIMGIDRKGPAL